MVQFRFGRAFEFRNDPLGEGLSFVLISGPDGAAHGGAYSASYTYDFGLDRVLDGLGVLIDSRDGRTDSRSAA